MKGTIPLVIALAGTGLGALAAEPILELDHVWVIADHRPHGQPSRRPGDRLHHHRVRERLPGAAVARRDGPGRARQGGGRGEVPQEGGLEDERLVAVRRRAAADAGGAGEAAVRIVALSAPWMPPGVSYEMLTPKTDPAGPSIWVLPRSMALVQPSGAGKEVGFDREKAMRHPLGARRIAGLRIFEPARRDGSDVTRILVKQGVASVEAGREWLMEVRLEGSPTHGTIDLRPALPMILRH